MNGVSISTKDKVCQTARSKIYTKDFKLNDTSSLNIQGQKNVYHEDRNRKGAGGTALISGKQTFTNTTRTMKRDVS